MKPHAIALAATLLLGSGAAPAAPRTVQAPHWGEGLFQFFQDRHFAALSSLMVSQHFQRLDLHADEAELLRGGLLLSWGMHQEAGTLFEHLLAEPSTEAGVRDRAWYFLARVRHARGLDDAAADALARIAAPLPGALEPERALLSAQVALARQQPEAAAAALQALAATPFDPAAGPPRAGWWDRLRALVGLSPRGADPLARPLDDAPLYARYNLGVAEVRAGHLDEGRHWLEALGRQGAADEAQRALRDQANLALGYAALQAGQPEAAREPLQRVRLQGPASAKALLGLGWAELALKRPQRALVPWQELAGRDPGDAAVLEARIAIPFALAELGADPAAEQAYTDALGRYADEQQRLGQTLDELRRGPWLDGLLALNPAQEMAWSQAAEALPPLPHAAQLAPVLADHAFQEGYKTLRDLQFLHAHLQAWQDTLASYRDLLAQRRAVFAQHLPALAEAEGRLATAPLRQRQQALEAALAQAEAAGDGLAFASAAQQDLLQRLQRAQAALPALPDESRRADSAERLRLLRGRLSWELLDQAPEAARQTRRQLQASGEALAQAEARRAGLAGRPAQEQARFADFAQRLDALERRIAALLPPLQAQARAQAQALQALAIDGLQDQQQRLQAYATQARHGIAQLHDRARAPQETADAPR